MAEVAREPKKKTKRYRALRMNLYFLIVFLLFTALIFKLGIVQIVEGDKHRQDAEGKCKNRLLSDTAGKNV